MRKLKKYEIKYLVQMYRTGRFFPNEILGGGASSADMWRFQDRGLVTPVSNPITGKLVQNERGDHRYKLTDAGIKLLDELGVKPTI